MQIIAVNWHVVELLSAAGAAATAFDEPARQSLVANIVPLAIFTGGLATVLLTAWIAWRYPRLRNYKLESQQEAVVT